MSIKILHVLSSLRITSTGPTRIATLDTPAPGWLLAGREVVLVAAGQGLKRDEVGVVLEQDVDVACRFDLGLAGAEGDAIPAQGGCIEPLSKWTPAWGVSDAVVSLAYSDGKSTVQVVRKSGSWTSSPELFSV